MASLRNNYIVILDWMVEDLNLTGKELIAYALIYGFCQDGNSVFSGSSSYVAKWIGTKDNSNARKILKGLCEKGLLKKIEKVVNGVTLVDYKACYPTEVKNTPGWGKNYPGGGVKITHHNIIDNIKDNIKEIDKEKIDLTTGYNLKPVEEKEKNSAKKEREPFTKPTVEQVAKEIMAKGYTVDAETFWNYYESNGWRVGRNPMKSWRAALTTWQRKELNNRMNYGRNYENEQEQQRRRSVEQRISELLHSAEEKMGFADETSDAL